MNYPNLQISWLRTFITVVDTGSLSAAALLLFRSQSAVSMHIKKLEAAFGCSLLSRGPRHLEVTQNGMELLSYARRILELQSKAHESIHGSSLTGVIRLGVPDDYASTHLMPVLQGFSTKYLNVDIELICEQSTSLVPRIKSNDLDIALISQGKAKHGEFLFKEPLVWVGSPKYELWRRNPLPVAIYEDGSVAQSETLLALSRLNRDYRIMYLSSGLAGQLALVEGGLAIAALTRCSVKSELQILNNLPSEYELPQIDSMDVSVFRSEKSKSMPVVDLMYRDIVQTLRNKY